MTQAKDEVPGLILQKKGNLNVFENYRTISLISLASKVMLRIIRNKLKRKLEQECI
ncbi:hypothetical protein DPMN_159861 [Dreissena polymorpha]|uniref:Uncharacterized protein n=1 Tax=Dreissena polymorpha TaxID=45954 RepID=A0A9D4EQ39_DREPO|nr:hypothetical protein DPMN_159861 [Dreissena polymorpha]